MKKVAAKKAAESFWRSVKKHSPTILTGVGIAGMITTTILAVQATPKALRLLEEKKADISETEKLPPIEVVKAAWKVYVPAVLTGILSTVCLIGANSVNQRRGAALAAAYSLSESALKEYREKVVETIGKKKEQAIRDDIAKDRVTANPVREVVVTDRGSTLCYDSLSGRYFKSDIETLRRTVNDLNRRMRDEMFISLNDFYCAVDNPDLGPTKLGDRLGWTIDKGYIDLGFSSQLTADGTPCLVLDYTVAPEYEYN
jgi:hypothetical protein